MKKAVNATLSNDALNKKMVNVICGPRELGNNRNIETPLGNAPVSKSINVQ